MRRVFLLLTAFAFIASGDLWADDYIEKKPSAYTYKAIYDSIYAPIAGGGYVPYTGATSTINLNSQHIVAGAGEINGTLDIGGTSIASGSISDSSGLIDFATTNVSGIGSISTDGGAFYSDGSGNVIISGTLNAGVTTVSNLYATNLYGKINNTHTVATTLVAGFAPILSGSATDFLNGAGAYSVPAGSGGGGGGYGANTAHPEYVPYLGANKDLEMGSQHIVADTIKATGAGASTFGSISITGTGDSWFGSDIHAPNFYGNSYNSHSEYVPYTGASSTVNLGSQHFTAKSSEISEMVTGKETINYTAGNDTGQGLAINLSNNNYGVIVSKSGGASTGLYSSTTGSVGTYTNHRFGFFTNNSNDSWSVLTNGNFVSGIDGTGTQNIITAGDITASHFMVKAIETNFMKVNSHILLTPSISDHTANGITIIGGAGETLVFGDLVYLKNNGKYWKARANSYSTAPVQGMSLGSATSSQHVTILTQGYVRDMSWTLGAGMHILLSPFVAGGWTHPWAMATAGYGVQILGYGYTGDVMYFNPDSTYVEI